jgi:hypothetical protein
VWFKSTGNSFKDSVSIEALDGGFLTRCLIVEAVHTKTKRRDYLDSEVAEQGKELSASLERLQEATAKRPLSFRFTTEALNLYHRRCYSIERRFRKEIGAGFLSRYQDYLVKLADLIQVSGEVEKFANSQDSHYSPDSQQDLILVDDDSLQNAYRLVGDSLKGIVRIREFCESAKPVLRVKTVLERHGACDRSKLLRYSHMMADELDRALRTLKESGEVIEDAGKFRLVRGSRR